jgi:hypothetical protein
MTDPASSAPQFRDRQEDLLTDDRVAVDGRPLGPSQGPWLLEDRQRNPNLADVMQACRHPQVFELLAGESETAPDALRDHIDIVGVGGSLGTARTEDRGGDVNRGAAGRTAGIVAAGVPTFGRGIGEHIAQVDDHCVLFEIGDRGALVSAWARWTSVVGTRSTSTCRTAAQYPKLGRSGGAGGEAGRDLDVYRRSVAEPPSV